MYSDVATPILLIIGGLTLLFAGKFLMRLIIGFAVGTMFGYLIVKVCLLLGFGLLSAVFLGSIGFIIGFFISWFLLKLAIAIVVGTSVSLMISIVLSLLGNIILVIMFIIIGIIVAYSLAEHILTALILLAGTSMTFIGFSSFFGYIISLFLTGVFLALSIYWRMRK